MKFPNFNSRLFSLVNLLLYLTILPTSTFCTLAKTSIIKLEDPSTYMYHCTNQNQQNINHFVFSGGRSPATVGKIDLSTSPSLLSFTEIPSIRDALYIRPISSEKALIAGIPNTSPNNSLILADIATGNTEQVLSTGALLYGLTLIKETVLAIAVSTSPPFPSYLFNYVNFQQILTKTDPLNSPASKAYIRQGKSVYYSTSGFGDYASFITAVDYTTLQPTATKIRSKDPNLQYFIFWACQGRFADRLIFGTTSGYLVQANYLTQEGLEDHLIDKDNRMYYFELIAGSDLLIGNSYQGNMIYLYNLTEKKFLWDIIVSKTQYSFCFNQKNFFLGHKEWGTDIIIYQPEKITECKVHDCEYCGLQKNFCIKCKSGKIFQNGNCVSKCGNKSEYNPDMNQCLFPDCPFGHYRAEPGCLQCPEGALECVAELEHTSCKIGYFLKEKLCYIDPCPNSAYHYQNRCIPWEEIEPGTGLDLENNNSTRTCRLEGCGACAANYKICKQPGTSSQVVVIASKAVELNYKWERYFNPIGEVVSLMAFFQVPVLGFSLESSIQIKNDLAILRLLEVDIGTKPNKILKNVGGSFAYSGDMKNIINSSKRSDSRKNLYKVITDIKNKPQIYMRIILYDSLWLLRIIRLALLRSAKRKGKIGAKRAIFIYYSRMLHFPIFNLLYMYVLFYCLRSVNFVLSRAENLFSFSSFFLNWNLLNIWLILADFVYFSILTYKGGSQGLVTIKKNKIAPKKSSFNEIGREAPDPKKNKPVQPVSIKKKAAIDNYNTLKLLSLQNDDLLAYWESVASTRKFNTKLGRYISYSLIFRISIHILLCLSMNISKYVRGAIFLCLLLEMVNLIVYIVAWCKGVFNNWIEAVDKLTHTVFLIIYLGIVGVMSWRKDKPNSFQNLMLFAIFGVVAMQNLMMILRGIFSILSFFFCKKKGLKTKNRFLIREGEMRQILRDTEVVRKFEMTGKLPRENMCGRVENMPTPPVVYVTSKNKSNIGSRKRFFDGNKRFFGAGSFAKPRRVSITSQLRDAKEGREKRSKHDLREVSIEVEDLELRSELNDNFTKKKMETEKNFLEVPNQVQISAEDNQNKVKSRNNFSLCDFGNVPINKRRVSRPTKNFRRIVIFYIIKE